MTTTIWTADRRLYLDKNGRVVEATDPTRSRLLVPTGGTLPLSQADALGLLPAPAVPVDAPALKGRQAPPNKARTFAEDT